MKHIRKRDKPGLLIPEAIERKSKVAATVA